MKLGIKCVRALNNKNSSGSEPALLRSWHAFLVRNRSKYLDQVIATKLETAQNEAAKQFALTEFRRKRLLVRERHQPIADGINIAALPNLNQDDVRTAP